jgi:hypothetical protein
MTSPVSPVQSLIAWLRVDLCQGQMLDDEVQSLHPLKDQHVLMVDDLPGIEVTNIVLQTEITFSWMYMW